MQPVANSRPVFLDLNLTFEIGRHLIEFANDPLEIIDLSRLLFDLTALQAKGCVT